MRAERFGIVSVPWWVVWLVLGMAMVAHNCASAAWLVRLRQTSAGAVARNAWPQLGLIVGTAAAVWFTQWQWGARVGCLIGAVLSLGVWLWANYCLWGVPRVRVGEAVGEISAASKPGPRASDHSAPQRVSTYWQRVFTMQPGWLLVAVSFAVAGAAVVRFLNPFAGLWLIFLSGFIVTFGLGVETRPLLSAGMTRASWLRLAAGRAALIVGATVLALLGVQLPGLLMATIVVAVGGQVLAIVMTLVGTITLLRSSNRVVQFAVAFGTVYLAGAFVWGPVAISFGEGALVSLLVTAGPLLFLSVLLALWWRSMPLYPRKVAE